MPPEEQAGSVEADPLDAELRTILEGGGPEAQTPPGADSPGGTAAAGGGKPGTPAGAASSQGPVKLAGREYKSLEEASKAHGNLYGRFSESQQILNWFKANLKDPKILAALAKNPKWSDIAAKLGLQAAADEIEEEEAEEEEEDVADQIDVSKLPPALKPLWERLERQRQEFEVWRDLQELRHEEAALEKELKRPLEAEERKNAYELLSRAPGLSFKEAWTLVSHERMLKEAVAKATAGHKAGKERDGRPAPIPGVGVPGVPLDLKKDPTKMSNAEWREWLKTTESFQNLLRRE